MKMQRMSERKWAVIMLFIVTLIPGATAMCRQLDCSAFTESLSAEAINRISVIFMAEIAAALAYIGFTGSAAFIKSEVKSDKSEKVFSKIIGILILVLFLTLAVIAVYTGIVEPMGETGNALS